MHRLLCGVALAVAACASPTARPPAGPAPRNEAALLLHNGVIFTARDEREVVSALALAGDRVLAAGSERALRPLVGPGTRVVDLRGRFVCPGFHDAHLHFEGGGRSLATLNLAGMRSLQQVLAAVQREAARLAPGSWISGRGWDHTLWPGQAWPTRQDLDRVAPRHPVYLRRVCGHAAWVNSAALRLARISAERADPPGGAIAREADGRTPSGILKENAIELAEPPVAAADSRRFFELALAEARRLGVTSVQDAGGSSFDELARLHDAGQLTVRVYAWGDLDQPLALHEARRRRFPRGGPLLVYAALKGYVDGALGAGTAALLEPYADAAGQGLLVCEEPRLVQRVRAATRAGFQVALHAIGDRGVRVALRAFAAALPDGARSLRHRVEHAQLVHPHDLPLFASAAAIASVQPCHLITDQRWVEQRVGAARAAERGYLWRALAQHAPLALGTDWPVEPLSPLRNLYAAVTRQLADPQAPGAGFHPAQRLSMGQALRAYTAGGAYAAFAEQRRGTLAPGQDADLVLLDRNPLAIPPAQLLETRVLATVLGGRVIYGSLE